MIVLLFGISTGLQSCSSSVEPPPGALEKIRTGAATKAAVQGSGSQELGPACDVNSEMAVSDGCLKAWRTALAGDTAGAMQQLRGLEKQYPKQSTAHFMMGQVMELAGDKKAAVKYYGEAQKAAEFNSLYLFKLAESLRQTGNAKDAIAKYRRLIEQSPKFVPGRLGLARALYVVDKNSPEARQVVETVLGSDPGNKDALALKAGMGRIR